MKKHLPLLFKILAIIIVVIYSLTLRTQQKLYIESGVLQPEPVSFNEALPGLVLISTFVAVISLLSAINNEKLKKHAGLNKSKHIYSINQKILLNRPRKRISFSFVEFILIFILACIILVAVNPPIANAVMQSLAFLFSFI